MAGPKKPCEGRLSEATKLLLRSGRDRAAWGVHACEVCGHMVGVLPVNADWVPETHWASVVYSRKGGKATSPANSKSAETEETPSEQS